MLFREKCGTDYFLKDKVKLPKDSLPYSKELFRLAQTLLHGKKKFGYTHVFKGSYHKRQNYGTPPLKLLVLFCQCFS
jgi:hypothetical protein